MMPQTSRIKSRETFIYIFSISIYIMFILQQFVVFVVDIYHIWCNN